MKPSTIAVHIFAFLVFLAPAVPVGAANRSESNFNVKENGQIEVDHRRFESIKEYLRSDYFKVSGKRCGTTRMGRPGPGLWALDKSIMDCTLDSTLIQEQYWPNTTLNVPVVVHIIHKTDGAGNITDDRVQRQIDVLNEDFAAMAGTPGGNGFNTKIQFDLVEITRTANDNWFNDGIFERAYKTALGWDQSLYCNIYVNSASGYLGYTYFPQDQPGVLDGLVIFYEAFGGRDEGIEPYDQGRTVVHEMGHYFGLYHTFEGYSACVNSYTAGDLIVDTPAEADAHYDCIQTYSCSTADPIHNYMNYTPDICMDQFTPEQGNRMVCGLLNYRPNLAVSMTVTTTAVSSVTSTSALSGGTITSEGAPSVTARGVCWSTSINPATSDSKTIDGDGTGSFISSITGLSPGTAYHIRAYAVAGAGTVYGENVSFNTAGNLYVAADGNCGGKTPCYDSIQEAVNNAQNGSILWIAGGTYNGAITLDESESLTLTLQGGWDSSFENQNGVTTTLQGAPKAKNGSLTLQNLKIEPE